MESVGVASCVASVEWQVVWQVWLASAAGTWQVWQAGVASAKRCGRQVWQDVWQVLQAGVRVAGVLASVVGSVAGVVIVTNCA